MLRSTKIVATLGPASSDPAVLERMVRAGVDVVRLNFSHGTAADHEQRAELVRDISRKIGRTVGIMCDLQGPKIRVGKFREGKVTLEAGAPFVLDAACGQGDATRVGLDYKELPREVEDGDDPRLGDGRRDGRWIGRGPGRDRRVERDLEVRLDLRVVRTEDAMAGVRQLPVDGLPALRVRTRPAGLRGGFLVLLRFGQRPLLGCSRALAAVYRQARLRFDAATA